MLDALFDFLRDDDFQDPASGRMNFPAYLYAYPAEEEYAFRTELPKLCEKFDRFPILQVPLVVNIFDHLVDHLSERSFGSKTYLDIVLEQEEEAPRKVSRLLRKVLEKGNGFYRSIDENVRAHQGSGDGEETRSYVFVHGWGSIHPYLTAHQFMGCMEQFIAGYKLILLYPGTFSDGKLQFLGKVDGRGPYRAQCLNEQIEFDRNAKTV